MELYDYQKTGVERLLAGSLLLCDEMGLGKTVMVCEALRQLAPKRAIIICPLSLKSMWEDTLHKCYPFWWETTKVYTFYHARTAISENVDYPEPIDVLIVDEAHFIKNKKAERGVQIKQLARLSKKTWLLTATPMPNNAAELWNPLSCIEPQTFKSYWNFVQAWCNVLPNPHSKLGYEVAPGVRDEKEFAAMLAPRMLRRTKEVVGLQLPKVTRQTIRMDCTVPQRRLYNEVMRELLVEVTHGKTLTIQNAAVRTLRARQVCVSPTILGGTDWGQKFAALHQLLENQLVRPVIFSQWSGALELVQESGVDGYFLHGGLTTQARDHILTAWRLDTKPLLATIGVGGVGLNLVESDTCIFLDVPWVPAEIEQAIARLDRIGQKKPISVVFLQTRGTIEEVVEKTLGNKAAMVDAINTEIEALRRRELNRKGVKV